MSSGAAMAMNSRSRAGISKLRRTHAWSTTQIFEPTASGAKAGDAEVITVTFDEHDGKTHLVSRSLCPSQEVRASILASGMEHGMRDTMDQLDELVASLGRRPPVDFTRARNAPDPKPTG
jgi:hypothetical protein